MIEYPNIICLELEIWLLIIELFLVLGKLVIGIYLVFGDWLLLGVKDSRGPGFKGSRGRGFKDSSD
jgi:hypothetical protein